MCSDTETMLALGSFFFLLMVGYGLAIGLMARFMK